MLNVILWGFHRGRNYFRGMWDVWNPSNKKVAAATTQPAQKQDKTWKKQSRPNASCWKEDGRNRGNNETLGHAVATSRKEPCWMPCCRISTGEEIILGQCEISGTLRIKKKLPQPPNQPRTRTKHEKNNRGKHERLGHVGATSRKEPCWMPLCGISTRVEINLGVCEMSGTLRIKK